VLKVGDMIQIGDTIGEVTQIRLHSTRLRKYTNEEVTIPNATLLTSHVVNYSALSRNGGLILHTKVGIGYEVPWRQVHAMLLDAAARTSGLAPEPAPFVLQRELGDFAVVYQLNVAKDSPKGMLRAYSELHQNILDVFNEHGVQIMTPAYEGDPVQPKIVAKNDWFAPPAKPPR
jgi:small-conductance mechanosensitive channel